MSERDLQDAVIALAELLGWHVHHDRPARTATGWRTAVQGHAGFPDLVLVRGPRLLFAELKSAKGKLSPEQAVWLEALTRVAAAAAYARIFIPQGLAPFAPRPDIAVHVWRPADWTSGKIEALLK